MKAHVNKHAHHEGAGTIADALKAHNLEISELNSPSAKASDFQALKNAELVVVMGGSMGVYEAHQYPFLKHELELMAYRISRDLPTIGICLGSQIMAEAAGSKVYKSHAHEVGWYNVRRKPEALKDPVISKLKESLFGSPFFHWHGDSFEIPKDAAHLMESDRFESQAFRLGNHCYGLQFHPEVSVNELPEWISHDADFPYGKQDGVQSKEEILQLGALYGANLESFSNAFISQFLGLISKMNTVRLSPKS